MMVVHVVNSSMRIRITIFRCGCVSSCTIHMGSKELGLCGIKASIKMLSSSTELYW